MIPINWKSLSLIACSILLLMHLGFILNNLWAGDFWEHRAVLRELINNPFNPNHPILKVNVPHAFFSPYMVTLGILGNYFGLGELTLLNIISVINLLLFFYCLFLLSKLFLDQVNLYRSFFLLLITHLFFWGAGAWGWSGFFHLGVLNFDLPYPSTFSFCLSIFSAYLYDRYNNENHISFQTTLIVVAVILLNWIIILTHPITFFFTATLFLLIFLKRISIVKIRLEDLLSKSNLSSGLTFILFLTLPLLLTTFWPYYPFFNLFTSASPDNQFHLDSEILYSKPYIRVFPIGIVFVLLYLEGWKFIVNNKNLIITILVLLSVYTYGFFTQKYGYGRVISYIVLYCHILLIPYLTLIWFDKKHKSMFYSLLILFSLPYLSYNLLPIIHRSIPFVAQKEPEGIHIKFIEKHLKYNQVILSDKETSRFIPAFGGRVIASQNPPYWIKDNMERREVMIDFFQDSTLSASYMKLIFKKYSVDYILLSPKYQWMKKRLYPLIDWNSQPIESHKYLLLKIKGQ